MTKATIIYVGPTLPAAEARALVPGRDVDVRPPAAVGDILNAAHARGTKTIVLVDGYFERMAAVWHKEILVALERGIRVVGAASMGALRAAELSAFGMIGVGAIFEAFARGELASDDEVAVAHLPAAHGYRAVSDAMVDIRAGLAGAVRARAITARTCAALVTLARARFYRERTWVQMIEDARDAALPAGELARLAARGPVAAKAADARAAIGAIGTRFGRRGKPRKIIVPRTWALRQLLALR